jgi:metal-responsive CopG/Arc/MetJ family transcriptional regulator
MISLYDDVVRTIIELPTDLVKDLDSLAEKQEISRAEAVRRAVTDYISARKSSRSDAAFGIWKSRHIDPLDYQDSLRNDWRR